MLSAMTRSAHASQMLCDVRRAFSTGRYSSVPHHAQMTSSCSGPTLCVESSDGWGECGGMGSDLSASFLQETLQDSEAKNRDFRGVRIFAQVEQSAKARVVDGEPTVFLAFVADVKSVFAIDSQLTHRSRTGFPQPSIMALASAWTSATAGPARTHEATRLAVSGEGPDPWRTLGPAPARPRTAVRLRYTWGVSNGADRDRA